ncbi:MAG: nucleotidyltransferase domain-containing protein [Candidatus Aenigmatarchaeota archaeon]
MKYNLVDSFLKRIKLYENYRKKYRYYCKKIKKEAINFFGKEIKLFVFGSLIKGESKPLSDIDIAIILPKEVDELKKAKFISSINRKFGENPFEIHIVSKEKWEKFYKKFVKEDFEEI